jgi:hypothetical protein
MGQACADLVVGCHALDSDSVKMMCDSEAVQDPNVPLDFRMEDPDSPTYQANEADYERGCRDGFRDNPPSFTTRPPPTGH